MESSLIRLARNVLLSVVLSVLAVVALLAAIWLPLQLRGYELLDERIESDGTGLHGTGLDDTRVARSAEFKVACSYLSFVGHETFVRVYLSPVARNTYACPWLRQRGDEPRVQVFYE